MDTALVVKKLNQAFLDLHTLVLHRQNQGMKIQKGLVQLLHDQSSVHGVQGFTSLILGQLQHTLEEGTATAPV